MSANEGAWGVRKHPYVVEARGEIAARYARAEYGKERRLADVIDACRAANGPFKTQREALRCGLSRILELGSAQPSVETYFGSIVLIDTRTGREEQIR